MLREPLQREPRKHLLAEAEEQAMGGKNQHAWIVDIDQRHQGKVYRVFGMERSALFLYLRPIGKRRLVTVMPVGDVELALREEILDQRDLLCICDWLQAMLLSYLVDDLYGGVFGVAVQQAAYASLRIVVEAHDRAEIGRACPVELQAIVLCLRQRVLVWQDDARTPRLQVHARQQVGARKVLPAVGKLLLVEIVARNRVLL